MSDYSQLKEQVTIYLNDLFPGVKIFITHVKYEGLISVFFVMPQNHQQLAELWIEISSAIAMYYQTKLNTDFEIWNLYVFYVLKSPIERGLKYRIENDPISSRKVVIDNFTEELTESTISPIITQHITNINLNITAQQPSSIPFEKHPKLGPAIDAALSITTNGRGKDNTDIDALLLNIESRLRNEI